MNARRVFRMLACTGLLACSGASFAASVTAAYTGVFDQSGGLFPLGTGFSVQVTYDLSAASNSIVTPQSGLYYGAISAMSVSTAGGTYIYSPPASTTLGQNTISLYDPAGPTIGNEGFDFRVENYAGSGGSTGDIHLNFQGNSNIIDLRSGHVDITGLESIHGTLYFQPFNTLPDPSSYSIGRIIDAQVPAVPEPPGLALMAVGFSTILLARRRWTSARRSCGSARKSIVKV